MGTTVAPQASSIAGEIYANQPSGIGQLGGMLVNLGSVYNSLSDSGGVMGAANDRNNGNVGAGVTDNIDPSKAPKKDISAEQVDKVVKRSDEIRASAMSNEDKKVALSELLTGEGIPHDPNSLDPFSPSDKFGLLSNRINVVNSQSAAAAAAASAAAEASAAQARAATEALQDVFNTDPVADAVNSDLLGGSLGGDSDLTGDVDTIASTVASEATGGLKAGDVVTDDRIVGDYEFVYDAENNVFHYAPFDANGNRIYTGETLDASTVGGFDPNAATTGATKSVTFDPLTGKASIEQVGDASNDTKDTDTTDTGGDNTSGITITLGGDGLLGGSSAVNTNVMGPTQDVFNAATDSNNTGETLTTGNSNATTATTDNGTGATSTVTNGATTGTTNTTVVDGSGDVTGTGDVFNTATDTKNTGETLTTGTSVKPSTVVTKGDDGKDGGDGTDGKDGVNGTDGLNGGDGGDGKDGKDGKDGATGLIMMGMLSSPIANNIFKTEFESNYLRPEYVDRILRGKGMNNNGRNT